MTVARKGQICLNTSMLTGSIPSEIAKLTNSGALPVTIVIYGHFADTKTNHMRSFIWNSQFVDKQQLYDGTGYSEQQSQHDQSK